MVTLLKILLGTDWVSNRNTVLKRIAEDVHSRKAGRILLVPELISHDMERRLCAAAGDTASRFAEVLSFKRLAKRVADAAGNGAEPCLDDGGRVVAMAAAARQLHSRLKAYASVETRPEFLTELVDAVDEFKRCCITPADLLDASRRTQGSLAQKLEELSLLLEAYDSLCQRGKRDPRDQMTWVLEQLEDGDFAQKHVFYIDGFPDFTRQHLAILEHLIQHADCVTVSLNCDRIGTEDLAFATASRTASQLYRSAQRMGIPVEIETVPCREYDLENVCKYLYQGKLEAIPALQPRLHVYREESAYRECQAAVERIMELVRAGSRWRDISIVCTDMAVYQPLIGLVCRQYGVPMYQSGTEDVLQKSVIVTLLSAMDAALGAMERQDVLRYLKSALSPLDMDTGDQIENYVIMWGITGQRWFHTWENHPDGLGGQWDEHATSLLAKLNAAREQAVMPLLHLRQGFADAGTLAEQVMALYRFLDEIRFAGRLGELADTMDASGDNRSAQVLNQLWEIILTAMEQLYDILGQTQWDTDTFCRLFTLLLSQYDVGTIPPVLDAVMVGPVNAMRCQQEKHLFVLGAAEGQLPGYSGSSGVLTDQERTLLRELGVPLTGGAMEGLEAEFSEIYGVFCGAQEQIFVSCPAGQTSFIYRRLAALAGSEEVPHSIIGPGLNDRREAGALLARWKAADTAVSLGVTEGYRNTLTAAEYTLGKLDKATVQSLYGKKLILSASQVDQMAECRLSYFLKYGLRAMERKEATVDPTEFGTYIHAVLEMTCIKVKELGGFKAVTLEDTLRIAKDYARQYASERFQQIDSNRVAYLLQRNEQELEMVVSELWQEMQQSEFEPRDFEVGFFYGEKMPPIEVPAKELEAILRGYVDRVDVWSNGGADYFRVVDYKTGAKEFDYCNVFNGVGLQMLLYLFALKRGGRSVVGDNPALAGVQYFSAMAKLLPSDGKLTDAQAQKIRQKEWKRSGLLLKDEDVLRAMDTGEEISRLSVSRKKDGTLGGDVADREQWRQLEKYVFRILGKLVDEIGQGNVEANPYTRGTKHDACAFCPYGSVCHRSEVAGRRNYQAMSAQRFWEEVNKEVGDGG